MDYQISKEKYSIAGLNVGLILRKGGIIWEQAKDYRCEFPGDPQIAVGISDEYIRRKHHLSPHFSIAEMEYMWSGSEFCKKLIDFDGFMLHASGVVYENRAYLFSAPSGTGKSTHTSIWQKHFGEDKTFIINDDKPVIRIVGDEVVVFGTPWSGKTDANKNASAPLRGICFLERGTENRIRKMSVKDAVHRILDQTIRPQDPEKMAELLGLLDRVLGKVSVFSMQCNMDHEAAQVAYDGMNKEGRD